VAYETIPGVAPNLTSLDVYAPPHPCSAPVVVWVHGGGYHVGDKAQQVARKQKLFNGRGWFLASVNYRLTKPGTLHSARYPDHFEDVAAAFAWVRKNIAARGGDPDRIAILGHSAGADIVSNLVTNPRYLGDHGEQLSSVRCAGVLDTAGFDKRAASGTERRQWESAFGNEPGYLDSTSATKLVRPGIGIPPQIVVVRGTPHRRDIEQGYLDALSKAGIRTARIDAASLTHGEVNSRIGQAGDTVMTPPILAFLDSCFA
jgi:acetyl esterase/lipase